jgi:voltage-gated potassium channel Kch
LALAWAVSFQLLDTLAAGSFTTELAGNFSTALYFSLATVTTLGYGDVTPVAPFARIWAVLEAVVGLLYVAVLIARLVADFRR